MTAHNRASRLGRCASLLASLSRHLGWREACRCVHSAMRPKRNGAGGSRRNRRRRVSAAERRRVRAHRPRQVGAACAAAATLALAGAALSLLERGGAAMPVALALSAVFLVALAVVLKPDRSRRPTRKRPTESAKGHTDRKPTGRSRCDKKPQGAVQQGSVTQDGARPDKARSKTNRKSEKPDDLNRKARNGCGRTRRRDRRGRFVSTRSGWSFMNLAKLTNRHTFGKACRGMREAIFAKRADLDASSAQDGRDAGDAVQRDGDHGLVGADFDRHFVDNRGGVRTACVAVAALAFAGAAASLLAQAGSTTLAELTFGPPIIAILMAALQSDHGAWQIGQRWFAGLTEYVRMRWLGRSRRSSRRGRRSRRRRMSPQRRPIQENRPARLQASSGRASVSKSLAGSAGEAAGGQKTPIF